MRSLLKSDYTLSLISKITTAFLGVVGSALCTRYLGVEHKGEYTYIIQVVNVLVLVLNLGIYQSYSYNYRKYGKSILYKYITIFTCQMALYVGIAIVLSFLTQNVQVVLISVLTVVQIYRIQMDNVMLVQNVRLRFITNILNIAISVMCYVVFFYMLPSSVTPVIISLILVDTIVVLIYFKKERIKPSIKGLDINFAKSVLSFGFLPMLSALLVTLNYSIDIFFLKKIGSSLELSFYSLAAGIMTYVWIIPDAFKDVVFSRAAQKGRDESVALAVKSSLAVLLILAIGFSFVGKLFISVMYGKEFLDSFSVTVILLLGSFSMVFFKIFGVVFLAEGRRIAHFIFLLISVVCNIILNILMIPNYGMYGAAMASVFSYNICGLLFLLYYSKINNCNPLKYIFFTKKDLIKLCGIIAKP